MSMAKRKVVKQETYEVYLAPYGEGEERPSHVGTCCLKVMLAVNGQVQQVGRYCRMVCLLQVGEDQAFLPVDQALAYVRPRRVKGQLEAGISRYPRQNAEQKGRKTCHVRTK